MPHQSHGGRPSGYLYVIPLPNMGTFLVSNTNSCNKELPNVNWPFKVPSFEEIVNDISSKPKCYPVRCIPTRISNLKCNSIFIIRAHLHRGLVISCLKGLNQMLWWTIPITQSFPQSSAFNSLYTCTSHTCTHYASTNTGLVTWQWAFKRQSKTCPVSLNLIPSHEQ